MEILLRDIRYGVRLLLKKPAFTLIAVVALALGIGANTAIFSVVNAVLLKPLPYKDADRLVGLYETDAGRAQQYPGSPGVFAAWRDQADAFEGVAAFSNKGWNANLTGEGEPERLRGFQVTANLFTLLGAHAALGRNFTPEEDRPGANQVVILSHSLWQRRYGADPEIIGKALTLNGQGYTVVGVMPADLPFMAERHVWSPLGLSADDESDRRNRHLEMIARLKPGVTIEQARAEMDAIVRRLDPDPNTGTHAGVIAMQEAMVKDVRPMLLVLFGAVAFVLAVACTNVANLMLARASSRRKEIAIRTALGASRLRLIRQLLTESVTLALLGGAVGLLLAMWGIDLLTSGLPEHITNSNPALRAMSLDRDVLGFTLTISLLTAIIFGLVPAIKTTKTNLNESLKEGTRTGAGGADRHRLRSALVVSEVALALVLLIGAGLMIKSFWQLNKVNPGFDPNDVVTAEVTLPETKYATPDQIAGFYSQVMERIAAAPGVANVGAVNNLHASTGFRITEHPTAEGERRPFTGTRFVSPSYFDAMRIRLLKGRQFTAADGSRAAPVAIIDEVFADRHFADEDPVGKHVAIFGATREIVGVAAEVKHDGLGAKSFPMVYLPYYQMAWSGMTLIVRASSDPAAMAPIIRREVLAVDKDQPVYDIRMLDQTLSASVAQQRFSTLLLSAFAALTLLLAAMGIYGVIAHSVTERTHEIGIRMALGARSTDVLGLIVRQGMALASVGVLVGLAAAFAMTRVMEGMLYGVSATDPVTFAAISLVLAAVALAATFIPARKATKVDPMVALRHE